jgi:hypothetical protein
MILSPTLLTKRCPYTNVVNFYDAAEPHIAIGSITRCGTTGGLPVYAWRFHDADDIRGGRVTDAGIAERNLRAQVGKTAEARASCHH